jgi:hypothetical protein
MNLFGKTSTKARIAAIHNEFNTASERLLKEAQAIANSVDSATLEKGKRLQKLGFTLTPEAAKKAELEKREKENKIDLSNATYYHQHYPHNKFIIEEQVKAICEKYGLVHGPVSRYKGFVPEKNLKQMEDFKLREEDSPYVIARWSEGNQYWAGVKKVSKEEWDASTLAEPDGKYHYRPFEICAPQKDFDLRNMRIAGHKITVPDPVVLQPVVGGYLIVSAWGDEASDPIIVNQKHN